MEPSRRRRALATAAVLLAAVPAAAFATIPADATAPPTPPGWTLQWADDFTGPAGALPSGSDWIFDLGRSYPGGPANWGTGEVQSYTNSPANIALDGAGNLRITALRDNAGNWTSSRIETRRGDFRPPPGGRLAIEGRIRLPDVTGQAALGYWPAFWALGSPYRGNYWNWPGIGEFDVMENVNGLDSVWGVLHCGVSPGGPCNETSGLGNSRACPGSPCQAAFHTYRFEWDESANPARFRWYVDGQQFHTVGRDQFDATTWRNMTSHAGYFVLLNLAMGGAFPDGVAGRATPTPATAPGHSMSIDYVAVWTAGGGTTTPPTTTTTTPPGQGWDAYREIQAEHASARSGGVLEAASEGGQDIGQLKNGDSLRFSGVRFGSGGARQFLGRVASGAANGVSGLVEVRLDDPRATPVGSFAIASTGGWQSWRTVPANISGVTGTHDVHITFTSGQPAAYVSVNWIRFGA
ncbi:glycoside hydrolase family 16 protein [Saccharothrix australiensis]|uniref:Beta-glucanase (GH16 family) n=1 Tax=Saccharothrix australiensis TaxID=2072 RepID=A0A495VUB6_9PSEU|nr:glycoside hydrolase family 16 protein [Saccharothrix australiensis]RKT52976.1 beta-glucanase (GH16 family) [Saccharothrix australiensis]